MATRAFSPGRAVCAAAARGGAKWSYLPYRCVCMSQRGRRAVLSENMRERERGRKEVAGWPDGNPGSNVSGRTGNENDKSAVTYPNSRGLSTL